MSELLDPTTRQHYEKYAKLAEDLGVSFYETVNYFGKDAEWWLEFYLEDRDLNYHFPLKAWDASFPARQRLAWRRGINMSLADNVCLTKHCIIYHMLGAEPAYTD